jgi:hypothetical protein
MGMEVGGVKGVRSRGTKMAIKGGRIKGRMGALRCSSVMSRNVGFDPQ